MATIKLGVVGAGGRMGQALREHLAETSGISWHAELEQDGSVSTLIASQPDVVVDLSVGAAVDSHGSQIVEAKIPYIIGATGVGSDTVDQMANLSRSSNTPVLLVPNFSLGANLMIRFAAQAAGLMGSPAITERHHDQKADAPSGTAIFTAWRIADAQGDGQSKSANYTESVAGVMGGRVQGVTVHSMRGAGYLAEQEVRFCLPGETLTIEHKSIDRRCFMPGIVYAIQNINRVTGLQVGLDTILEL